MTPGAGCAAAAEAKTTGKAAVASNADTMRSLRVRAMVFPPRSRFIAPGRPRRADTAAQRFTYYFLNN
jgi:hypothetical protein